MQDENDIVHQLLDDSGGERKATGAIDGVPVTVVKKYEHTPRNEEYWRVRATVTKSDIETSRESQTFTTGTLDEMERAADQYFEELLDRHPSLEEVEGYDGS